MVEIWRRVDACECRPDYFIAEGPDTFDLANIVRMLLGAGWELHGSAYALMVGTQQRHFQPMVRRVKGGA